jgi:hypothetical protein
MSKLLPQCTANEAVILRADYIADFNAGRGGAYGRKLAPSENAYGWMQDCGDLYVRRLPSPSPVNIRHPESLWAVRDVLDSTGDTCPVVRRLECTAAISGRTASCRWHILS